MLRPPLGLGGLLARPALGDPWRLYNVSMPMSISISKYIVLSLADPSPCSPRRYCSVCAGSVAMRVVDGLVAAVSSIASGDGDLGDAGALVSAGASVGRRLAGSEPIVSPEKVTLSSALLAFSKDMDALELEKVLAQAVVSAGRVASAGYPLQTAVKEEVDALAESIGSDTATAATGVDALAELISSDEAIAAVSVAGEVGALAKDAQDITTLARSILKDASGAYDTLLAALAAKLEHVSSSLAEQLIMLASGAARYRAGDLDCSRGSYRAGLGWGAARRGDGLGATAR